MDNDIFCSPLDFLEALNSISSQKIELDTWQKEVLGFLWSEIEPFSEDLRQGKVVSKNIFIAVAGGRGCGKSVLLAIIGMWALSVFTQQTIVTVSANTESQIERSVWLAYEYLFNNLRLSLFLNRDGRRSFSAKKNPNNRIFWQIFGAASDLDKIRGTHADVTIRQYDESSGIGSEVFNTLFSGLVRGLNIILVFGNPVSSRGFFADIFIGANIYDFYKKNISILECEHLVKNLPSLEKHLEAVRASDPTGDRYNVEVLGQFPANSTSFFFSDFQIESCRVDLMPPITQDTVIGIDVAGGVGKDRTVIATRRQGVLCVRFVGQITTARLADMICEDFIRKTRFICIDAVAVGLGVVQSVQYRGGYVFTVMGNQASSNPSALNKRAELYIQLKAFLASGARILVPIGEKIILENELRSIKIDEKEQKFGKLKMCDKDELERSPDIVDALTYTFAVNQPTTTPIYA